MPISDTPVHGWAPLALPGVMLRTLMTERAVRRAFATRRATRVFPGGEGWVSGEVILPGRSASPAFTRGGLKDLAYGAVQAGRRWFALSPEPVSLIDMTAGLHLFDRTAGLTVVGCRPNGQGIWLLIMEEKYRDV
ncbi:hypothetical protein GH722_10735 [Alphaproteobacteria bacterium HT1-32]|nr:hypothetical protein [Alphaproteobacteria bacterium HT1-32]